MRTAAQKDGAIKIICLSYIILFVYTAVSKLLSYSASWLQMGQSPFITRFAGVLVWLVPVAELTIVVLLLARRTRLLGLYGTLAIMTLFTVYIYAMLRYSYYVPCSCGGALAVMSWTQHFWFNIVFCILAVWGILLYTARITWLLPAVVLAAAGIVGGLVGYTSMQEADDGHFVRKAGPVLIQKAVIPKEERIVQIAGMSQGYIYFSTRQQGQLWRSDWLLQQQTLVSAYFPADPSAQKDFDYTLDPWGATVLCRHARAVYAMSSDTGYTACRLSAVFTQAVRCSAGAWLIRGFTRESGRDPQFYKFVPGKGIVAREDQVTEQRGDWGMSQDGKLLYDAATNSVVYVYYYRSSFALMDTNLGLLQMVRTIDQTKEKTFRVRSAGNNVGGAQYFTNATPKKVINTLASAANGRLYIRSVIPAVNEEGGNKRTSATVDVYDMGTGHYIYSLTIPAYKQEHMTGMLVAEKKIVVLYQQHIALYQWNE